VIPWNWLAIGAEATLAVYAAAVIALFVAGKRAEARAAATFVPDCLILFQRLLRDGRVPRREKLLPGALVCYLASPIDLIPDFVPVAGALDDAVLVLVVLRRLLNKVGAAMVEAHWPGPTTSLRLILRLAGHELSSTGARP
jgi:uncharacterized membrane protein YkvA (DUF1232 family)